VSSARKRIFRAGVLRAQHGKTAIEHHRWA
jgi:hypothetical protein